ncbi:hypothetical protein [Nonomuraea sp. 10N515B]|uniref:hypothetical protein n=1 Tax=Nonomuraea sp. 10N515B TaxID=3457422 RepID=UPI003FCDD02E
MGTRSEGPAQDGAAFTLPYGRCDRQAVYGNSTVCGSAVVKNSALVQGGGNLSGSVVIGGDAEPATACGSGTYLKFNPDRRCDGGAGETDVNPPHPIFSDNDLAFGTGGGDPTPTPVNLAANATPSASYTSPWESVAAINDGAVPARAGAPGPRPGPNGPS